MNKRFTPQQVTQAKLASRAARDRLLYIKRERISYTTAARGHIPFDGLRTCAEVQFDARTNMGVQRLSREVRHG